jgi:hypothetical protein
VLSHVTAEERAGAAQEGAAVYRNANASVTLRSRERLMELFDGFQLVEPGLVRPDEWHPDHDASIARYAGRDVPTWILGGVGRSI